jgi:Flp pilus assembly protein TadD
MTTIPEVMAIGSRYLQAGDWPRAAEVYRKVIEANPYVAQAWYLLGAVHQVQGQIDESVSCYEQALRLVPDFAEVHNNLALALPRQGRREEAVAHLREAIRCKPDYAEAYSNLGNALQDTGELDEAIASYRQAIKLDPSYAAPYNNMGNALRVAKRLPEAVSYYDEALQLEPGHAQVHLSRALARLEMGDFERGWPEYEWRLKCPEYAVPTFRQPLWDGSPLHEGTILLYADHGLGDAIQFIRYARMVRDRGGQVIVASRRPTARLLASCRGVDQVVVEGEDLPEHDVHAPLMSLPRIFGTTLADVPAEVPYLFADAALMDAWRSEVALLPGFKVGIAWQGNPEFQRDRQRSFQLALLAPVARLAGIRLISLQKGVGTEQLGAFSKQFAVTDLANRQPDFMETAAVLKSLDLVITPDTSLAHLAGALGVPVWTGLPFSSDWRWLMDRDDSPWYPTMRLFRQKRWGDWDEVFERMAGELERMVPGSRSA